MEFSVASGQPQEQRSPCIVAGVFERRKLSTAAKALDQATDGAISALLKRGDMDGELGQTLWLHHVPGDLAERILLVGCGKERDLSEASFRKLTSHMIAALKQSGAATAHNFLTDVPVKGRDLPWKIFQSVLVVEDALYRFDELKSNKKKDRTALKEMVLNVEAEGELDTAGQILKRATATAIGMQFTRDLGNRPGNVCTPVYLADQAKGLKKVYKDLKVDILDEETMEKEGMGALLSVSRGSEQPARLIVMDYRGGKKNDKPVVLVGKGITFDTGGISLKPGEAMDEMKYDMGGAAAVMGAMKACAELKLPMNVIGVIAAAENMPDGRATKPGDIITTMSGQTVEVLNTDAEGRLVLCDALTYVERFDPEVVVDMATLTGACIIALGHQATAVLGNSASLTNDLLTASRQTLDRAWELPLWDEYQEQLNSNFADMANIGGRPAGTITAACFLSRFTKKYKWAHLDIAGVAWKSGKEKGATGRPVPLVMQFLFNRVKEA
ncbi:leucyl aminopeptidase [Ectothiorhodospira haloalkaliphila]|uniref:leucyl aminopeptidase n=1 Tax=Ectothiorhodospira haloalkaliphila TaxID=421628 RepID=UPI001EE7998B|nr:leucyl aminopeptidase [Ectothiorhodospira haloalkaliphila]MCG5524094.1 leucyl aminopeptidase [Ectothiorhodospira haloalkaliphila]